MQNVTFICKSLVFLNRETLHRKCTKCTFYLIRLQERRRIWILSSSILISGVLSGEYHKEFSTMDGTDKERGVKAWILKRNILICGNQHGIFTRDGPIMMAQMIPGNRLLKKAAIL